MAPKSSPTTNSTITTPSTISPRTESGYSSNEDAYANESLRRAFQFGRQPRLANYRFILDDGLAADFAVEDWSIPQPVIRISRSKFESIFVHNKHMVRRFKSHSEPRTPDAMEKGRNQRLKARIAATTIDLENFIVTNMTRRKAMLLNQYRAYNSAILSAVECLEQNAEKSTPM